MAVSGVACSQGRQPAAVFFPLGHPTPYAYARGVNTWTSFRYVTSRHVTLYYVMPPPCCDAALKNRRMSSSPSLHDVIGVIDCAAVQLCSCAALKIAVQIRIFVTTTKTTTTTTKTTTTTTIEFTLLTVVHRQRR
jgi:predicted transporter